MVTRWMWISLGSSYFYTDVISHTPALKARSLLFTINKSLEEQLILHLQVTPFFFLSLNLQELDTGDKNIDYAAKKKNIHQFDNFRATVNDLQ